MRVAGGISRVSYTSHATALITAAIIPMTPASMANVLTTPPRVREENDNATPSNPKKIATHARIKPSIAPVMKLAIAAINAMMEGILNFAARGADPESSIMYNYALALQLTQPLKYPILKPFRWGRTGFDLRDAPEAACRGRSVGLVKNRVKNIIANTEMALAA